jgi:hypothetical protein
MASTPGVNEAIVKDKATLHGQRLLKVIKSLNTNNSLITLKQAG